MCHDIGLEHDGEVPVEWEPLMSTVCSAGGVPPSREYDRGCSKWHLLSAHLSWTPKGKLQRNQLQKVPKW